MTVDHDDQSLLALFEALALKAGAAILEEQRAGIEVETKSDQSPVTRADRAAEKIILDGLREARCVITCVAEEQASNGIIAVCAEGAKPEFLLVDALDGTREFIAGRPDYTVNIGLVRDDIPVLGVVYAPARGLLYSGGPGGAQETKVDAEGRVTERRSIRVSPSAGTSLRILASRSHNTPETDAFIARYPMAETVNIGSSLKFCMMARGDADLYPRFGPTMQWDTAAGDAVLRAAGGRTRDLDGRPLAYGPRAEIDGVAALGVAIYRNPDFIADTEPAL